MKKYKKLTLLILAVFLLIILVIFLKPKKEQSAPTASPKATYQTLIPGQSSEADVKEKLGKPVKEVEEQDRKVLEYPSSSQVNNHKFFVKENKIVLIKEIVTLDDNRDKRQITREYGETEQILYGPDAGASFYLFVYPADGIAYIGHVDQDLLLEVWYFEPTTFEEFRENYAKEYSDELERRQ